MGGNPDGVPEVEAEGVRAVHEDAIGATKVDAEEVSEFSPADARSELRVSLDFGEETVSRNVAEPWDGVPRSAFDLAADLPERMDVDRVLRYHQSLTLEVDLEGGEEVVEIYREGSRWRAERFSADEESDAEPIFERVE